MSIKSCLAATAAVTYLLASSAFAAVMVPESADIVFIVDESGSMGGEHAFINDVIDDLDAALSDAGVTSRNYGLVGFGGSSASGRIYGGHVGGVTELTDAQSVKAATSDLKLNGGTEDGYQGLDFALQNYNYTSAARNFILVTDEDRDNRMSSLTFQSMLSALGAHNVILNAVVNNSLYDSTSAAALGVNDSGEAYVADGNGGFKKTAGGILGNGSGSTSDDYAKLATQTGGAVWDLNLLRNGGASAESFTSAFIDIKVEEIQDQIGQPSTVPVPASSVLLLSGLLGFGAMRRRKAMS